MRKKFFQEPLIRYLWSMFIETKPSEVLEYLTELKEEKLLGSIEKYNAIVKDMHDLSEIVNLKIYV